MILQTAEQIAKKYNQTVRKNDYKGFTLESNKSPDIDYYKFSGYEFKNLLQDEFEILCENQQIDWRPDLLQCPDCWEDWDYCSCNEGQ